MNVLRTSIFAATATTTALVLYTLADFGQGPPPPDIQTIHIDSSEFSYWPAGEFRIANQVVDPPKTTVSGQNFEIMKFPVSQEQYRQCVADGICNPTVDDGRNEVAQTNVSHNDAVIFADWLSDISGETWRLPSDAEWLRVAGDQFLRPPETRPSDTADPSQRWLSQYRSQVASRGKADPTRLKLGSLGENKLGVADMGGNMWEWTSTCFQNARLTEDGQSVDGVSEYCGLRVAQGKHRAFVNVFVRDARVGGCAVGLPPDFLGFRLVRDAS